MLIILRQGLASGLPSEAAALDLSQIPKYDSGPKYENLRKRVSKHSHFLLIVISKMTKYSSSPSPSHSCLLYFHFWL